MNDAATSRDLDQTPGTTGDANAFVVHASVLEVSANANPPDTALLNKLVRRRLSRLERVLASHGGSLVRQMPQGLVAAFDSAESAVLVACEMQRRCAVIPQISETQIGLKIGIHPVQPGRNSNNAVEDAALAASRLAMLLAEGSIVASDTVVDALPETLREKASDLAFVDGSMTARSIDWGSIPMRPAPAPKPVPTSPAQAKSGRIVLLQGGRSYRLDENKSAITIGRDLTNDIVINDPKASRQHCRIIFSAGNHLLVDLSTNGTYVQSATAVEVAVRKSMVTLSGKGRIGFGHSCRENEDQVFEFEIS
jgi:class 3 adenylate cyclase